MAEQMTLRIGSLGAQGDGVANENGEQIFVPLTVPGDKVVADVEKSQGRLVEILEPGPDRIAPVCRHFGTCGGCALQHLNQPAYLAWKQQNVVASFRFRGIEARVGEVMQSKGKRRRAVFSARQSGEKILLGYHEASSHALVELIECPVLDERIVCAIPLLRRLVEPLVAKREDLRIVVTSTDGGLDVAIEDILAKNLSPALRAKLAHVSAAGGLARVSLGSDPVYEAFAPSLKFGPAEVTPPPGTFLQAVAEAEDLMSAAVLRAIGKARYVADLFCGVGTFAFRLAQGARVFAVDGDKHAVAALQASVKKTRGLKPLEARARDLFREPLSATELNDFDAVVFDPPRAGADAQAKMIARSKVKTIVAVSCNPATLARDARTLVDGGYKLESVTPIDQFLYSPHIEVVAVFRR